jgi:hypothetical protein
MDSIGPPAIGSIEPPLIASTGPPPIESIEPAPIASNEPPPHELHGRGQELQKVGWQGIAQTGRQTYVGQQGLQFRENRCDEQPLIARTNKTAANARKRHTRGLLPRIECILPKKYSSRFPAGENAARKNSDISLSDDSLIRHHRYTRPRIAGICLPVDGGRT